MTIRWSHDDGTWLLLAATLAMLGASVTARPAFADKQGTIDFNREIRPILSEYCFACHGPDEGQRKAKLRLDTREGLQAELKDGGLVLSPGKPAESRLIQRVTHKNPGKAMPPAATGKHLTEQQIALLGQWIEQGARWSNHWAFIAPRRPPLPKVNDASWPHNGIDYFVLARLQEAGLSPSPAADRSTLLRRVTFDLTGLPPTPAEYDRFLGDSSPSAYEKVVERLLESPRYGEHMGRYWLDAARYGDTHGLHLDNYREMWPYRQWVIQAFNSNQRYDRFLIEQLAGDLLPNATLDQQVATGFNRCHVTTSEGGSIEEEVYVRNTLDRVETTGTVVLGLTIGCARCHDHKFDPISQRDFYQLFAYFNNIEGNPMDGNAAQHAPIARITTPEQLATLHRTQKQADELRKQIAAEVARASVDEATVVQGDKPPERAEYVWIDDEIPSGGVSSSDGGVNGQWQFVTKPDHPVFSGSRSVKRTADGLSQHFFEKASPTLHVGEGDTLFAYVFLDPAQPPREIMLQWNTGEWKHRAYWGDNLIAWGAESSPERLHMGPLPRSGEWVRLEVPAIKVGLKPGMEVNGWAFTQFAGTVYWDRAGLVTRTPQGNQPFQTLSDWLQAQKTTGGAGLPKPIQTLVKLDPAKRTEPQRKQLRDYFVENAFAPMRGVFEPLQRELAAVEHERTDLEKVLPTTLVFKERSDLKPAFILKRGEYDHPGQKVERNTPAFLPPMTPAGQQDRLSLARWFVGSNQPLTARVAVNRFWQQCFGTGLVKTADDFGSQGEPASHPELLDWLAVEFQEDGWDIKKFMKRIVMSVAYQQSSRATADRLAKDPENRWLARGPRFRLDAEMLRDQALALSGLLVERVGGASVKPPQPRGLWEAVAYTGSNTAKFTADTGIDKVHRRSLYTFWKRTSPPPQMSAFDAPSREGCTIRRERTNTPLQALLLLNEKQYVECARALAERTLKEGGDRQEPRIAYLFRLATGRRPDAAEMQELAKILGDLHATFIHDLAGAQQLIAVGESKANPRWNPSELAAWTLLANLVLNLDEVINKG